MKLSGGKKTKSAIKKTTVKVVVGLALFLMPFITISPVHATSEQDQLNNINQQIQETNQKLNETKSERKTLQGQVSAFDRQIGDIQAQINSTDSRIRKLDRDMVVTDSEIKTAETKLATTREQLGEYLRVMYEDGQVSTLEMIAVSRNFSDFVNRSEYMESVQFKVKDTADKVISLKKGLEIQKKQLEASKKEAEELRAQQAAQRGEVSSQRSGKNYLLSITKGNEAEYQALVAKLQKQQDQLEYEIWSKIVATLFL